MEKYLLDTNVCINLFKRNEKIIDRILEIGENNCYVSEITIAELYYGASKSGKASHFKDVDMILKLFQVVPIYPCLSTYGQIKSDLEKNGCRIDEFDLLIGASAIHNSMIVVTHNTRHFNRIQNILIEDWE